MIELEEITQEEEMNKFTFNLILSAMSAGLFIEAQASPAPFVYAYKAQGPATIESGIITTSGTIKSICASWEFTGQVKLEVSADAGNSYVPVINGKPLAEGFIPGNQLRFKAILKQESSLVKVIIGCSDTSGVSNLFRNPELADFKFHKAINISGSNEELFNYPVKIRIGEDIDFEGKVENDLRDIRVTAADGQTPLEYCLEKQGLSPEGGATVFLWVKVPQIPKEGIILNIYYGNKFALAKSNPENVFSFLDDFSANNLNAEVWIIKPGFKKYCAIRNGQLQLSDCSIISRNFRMKEAVLEFRAKADRGASVQGIIGGLSVYSSSYPGAEHTIAINDVAKLNIGKPIEPLTDYIYKVIVSSKGVVFERYAQDYKKEAEIQFLDVGTVSQGPIGLKADAGFFNDTKAYFQWVRVRPYAEVEPEVRK